MADGGGFCQASCCETCGNLSFSTEWFQAFGVVLCHQCKRDEALISKGNAMTLYCLSAKDMQGLGCISKDNPQQKNWSAMKLYLRRQVEDRARQKYGDLEAIRQLRHDRTQAKVQGWLTKRTRAGEGAEEEDDDGGDEGTGGTGGGGVRVKLSAAATRVRARLASEYETCTAGKGRDSGASGAAAAGGSGAAEEPAGGHVVEEF